MNICIFFFMTTAVVTAAPYATSDNHQEKSGKPVHSTLHACHHKSQDKSLAILKQVISNEKHLKTKLPEKTRQIEVQDVFMNGECNHQNLCQAGKVLAAYNATDLGLKSERDWWLPRWLRAYSKNCIDPDNLHKIPLFQLLDEIKSCAQKEYKVFC